MPIIYVTFSLWDARLVRRADQVQAARHGVQCMPPEASTGGCVAVEDENVTRGSLSFAK